MAPSTPVVFTCAPPEVALPLTKPVVVKVNGPNPELSVTAPGGEVLPRNGKMQVTSLGLSWQYCAGLVTAKSTPVAVVDTNRTLVPLFVPVNDGS